MHTVLSIVVFHVDSIARTSHTPRMLEDGLARGVQAATAVIDGAVPGVGAGMLSEGQQQERHQNDLLRARHHIRWDGNLEIEK